MSVQKRYAGRTDVPLTDIGAQQAAAAAKRLASAGLGVIVTSPLLRTVQTAQAVAAVTGATVVTDEGFRGVPGDRLRRLGGPDLRRGAGTLAGRDERLAG